MKKVRVSVTQEIIDEANDKYEKSFDILCNCPIALAIKPMLPNSKTNNRTINECERGIYIDLPELATKFVNDFDDRKPVKPIDFYITVPDIVFESADVIDAIEQSKTIELCSN